MKSARDNSKIIPDIIIDATDFDAVEKIFTDFGPFDGAVNCAGSLFLKPAHLTSQNGFMAVSYTHLDVYKRQACARGSLKHAHYCFNYLIRVRVMIGLVLS